MASTSLDLSQIRTDSLISASTFRALIDVYSTAEVDALIAGVSGGSYTNEEAQDAVGSILSVSFEYVDATPAINLSAAVLASLELANTSIQGSTGSTDNRILCADGTGGATAQAGAATLADDGTINADGGVRAYGFILGTPSTTSPSTRIGVHAVQNTGMMVLDAGTTIGVAWAIYTHSDGTLKIVRNGFEKATINSSGALTITGNLVTIAPTTDLHAATKKYVDDADDAIVASLGAVATSNDYNDLDNKPDLSALNDVATYANLASFPGTGTTDFVYIASDTGYMYRWNGSGYTQLTDQTAIWGQVSGTLSNQTDLQSALDAKAATSHNHNASEITSGTVASARLGSGTANSTTYLRGDQTWQTIGGGGDALVSGTLDQFANVTQTAGQTLAITSSTTLSGGTHSGTNTGDQPVILFSLFENGATYVYHGGTKSDGGWTIYRYDNATVTRTVANIGNNGGYANLAAAWTDRVTLTYA